MTSDNSASPRISIITPSYNQGRYIEETILSVIGQHYPNFEYIIMDGGSTDNTVDIIKKYEGAINHWVSEKDDGQANAINRAMKLATGDIIGWINSDDYYLPGVLNHISNLIDINKAQIIAGNCIQFNEEKKWINGSDLTNRSYDHRLPLNIPIIQPSSFFTKKAWELAGKLNENLSFTFDWEWFIRNKKTGTEFIYTQKYLSVYRFHELHKTGTGESKRASEIYDILKSGMGIKYAELYMYLFKHKRKINSVKYYIHRVHFSRLEHVALTIRFLKLLKFNRKEINFLFGLT
jgi:glycosyltransferase involved in cell wall biosynthesis